MIESVKEKMTELMNNLLDTLLVPKTQLQTTENLN